MSVKIPFTARVSRYVVPKGKGNRLGREYIYYRIAIPTETVEALGGLEDNELVQVLITKTGKIASSQHSAY
jgi:hypothetical protein